MGVSRTGCFRTWTSSSKFSSMYLVRFVFHIMGSHSSRVGDVLVENVGDSFLAGLLHRLDGLEEDSEEGLSWSSYCDHVLLNSSWV